jgi:hypothetical protein
MTTILFLKHLRYKVYKKCFSWDLCSKLVNKRWCFKNETFQIKRWPYLPSYKNPDHFRGRPTRGSFITYIASMIKPKAP